ncbi:glycosyltransferase [Curtobacterium pusillum]|uniref:glycosyltransferase n=1 Tax=Curtobacterium pusillum TaxID=69373 RepID=UPI0016435286|nr:glycosyltransferase [Curtobacterium pusillum]
MSSRWIKQRPHFLSEALGRVEGVDVAFFDSLFVKRGRLVKGQRLAVPVWHLPLVPQRLRERLTAVDAVMSTMSALLLFVLWHPDVVIVTHARHQRLVRVLRTARVRIIYDCMDLNREFSDATQADIAAEHQLRAAAELVWCSSAAIADDVRSTHPDARTQVVRNALDRASAESVFAAPGAVEAGTVRFIGTVSEWFRFEDVLALLQAEPDIRVELVGPTDVRVPSHPRLIAIGPKPHAEVLSLMATSDVLVMPFEITPLVLGVDPVKVYEYVVSGRPVVCSDYPELAHFGPDISRVSGTESFVSAVLASMGAPGRTQTDVRSFVDHNNWDARARSATEAL